MKTLEERVETIEKELGIKPRTGYTWSIKISDGDRPFSYTILNGRGDISMSAVAESVAKLLDGDLSCEK